MNTESNHAHQMQLSDVRIESMLARLYRSLPKLKVVDPNDDPDFVRQVKHAMKPKERLMEFVVRTGLGRSQALAMSRSEISAFVEQAGRNAANETSAPTPRFIPTKFFIDPVEAE